MDRPWHAHPLVRRLPLVFVILAGLWFFRDPASEREIVWRLPRDRAGIERVEVQLRDPGGAIVQRSEFFFGSTPAPEEVKLALRLPEDRYDSEVRVSLRDGGQRTWTAPVEVRGDVVIVPFRGR